LIGTALQHGQSDLIPVQEPDCGPANKEPGDNSKNRLGFHGNLINGSTAKRYIDTISAIISLSNDKSGAVSSCGPPLIHDSYQVVITAQFIEVSLYAPDK
jgi:hypothetical protein